MASHRMPDSDRPRRPVPAWVTAPPEDALEARPAPPRRPPSSLRPGPRRRRPPSSTRQGPRRHPHVPRTRPGRPGAPVGTAGQRIAGPCRRARCAHVRPSDDEIVHAVTPGAATPSASSPLAVVVPDFPPDQDLLPPAPTSPAVHTLPFDQLVRPTPPPVSPVDAGPLTPPAAARRPRAPDAGRSGGGPAAVLGPRSRARRRGGHRARTERPRRVPHPARFAQHQVVAAPAPTPSAPPQPGPARGVSPAPRSSAAGVRTDDASPTVAAPVVREPAPTEPLLQVGAAAAGATADGEDATTGAPAGARRIGATPGAALGAVAGIATVGLAAWWFTAPGTVHGVGLVLGVLALLLSVVVLRDRSATWQRRWRCSEPCSAASAPGAAVGGGVGAAADGRGDPARPHGDRGPSRRWP